MDSNMDSDIQSLDLALLSEFFHTPQQFGTSSNFALKERQPETYQKFFSEVKKTCQSSVVSIIRSKKFHETVKLCYKQIFKVIILNSMCSCLFQIHQGLLYFDLLSKCQNVS